MRWHSTPESVEKGEPTWLAVLETVAAVIFYWWVAWWFETHLHLLVSIFVAPLLLLRSPASMEKGARWFMAYWDSPEITLRETPWRFWLIVLAGGATGFACAYWLSLEHLPGHQGWSLFARGMLVGMAAMWGAVAVAGVGAVAVAVAVAGAGTGAVAVAAGAVAAAVVVAVVVAVAVAGAVAGTVALVLAGAGEVAVAVLVTFFGFPYIFGIWLRSLAVRMAATLRHPWQGLGALPDNWRQSLWVVDSWSAPELIPGLRKPSRDLSFEENVNDFREGRERLLSAIFILIFFLPAFLYRLSLKSTCWLYLPLMYVGGRVWTHESAGDGPGTLVATVRDGWLEWSRRWLAGGVIVATLGITWSAQRLGEMHDLFPHAPVPLYLWAFDLLNLAPWQKFSLFSAALTGVIAFFSDYAYRHWDVLKEKKTGSDPHPRHVHDLSRLLKLRNASTIALLILAFGYVVLTWLRIDPAALPPWLLFLEVIYGPYVP